MLECDVCFNLMALLEIDKRGYNRPGKVLSVSKSRLIMSDIDQEQLREKLEELRLEHRDLDDVIHRLQMAGGMEQMQLQRLKKRKLALKELILKIEDDLIPDFLA